MNVQFIALTNICANLNKTILRYVFFRISGQLTRILFSFLYWKIPRHCEYFIFASLLNNDFVIIEDNISWMGYSP